MNINIIKGNLSKVVLVGLLGISYSCYGAPVACDTSNTLSKAVTGESLAGFSIARAPGAVPDDFGTLGTVGCASGNIAFSNLVYTSPGSAATTYISTLANQTFSGAAGVTAVFSSIRGADSSGTDGNINDDVNNWRDSANGTTTTISNRYDFTTTSSTTKVSVFTLALLGENLGAAGTLGNVGSISGTVNICLGGAFTSNSLLGCAGTVQTITLVSGVTTYFINLSTPQLQIGVWNNITIAGGTGLFGSGGTTFLTSFDESFGTPEPSTFGLFGAALAGLGMLRYRSTKKRNS